MKKLSVILLTTIVFLLTGCEGLFHHAQSTPPVLKSPFVKMTIQSKKDLRFLKAKKADYTYKDDRLILGDDSIAAPNKQIFLIHNRSVNPILVDFLKGHIGVSAGITQMIQPNEWYLYLYIKHRDMLPTEDKKGHRIYKRPVWTCQKGNPSYDMYKSCRVYLGVYEIPYDLRKLQASNSILDYQLFQILTSDNSSGWLVVNSYPTITKLLQNAIITKVTPINHYKASK